LVSDLVHDILLTYNLFVHHSDQFLEQRSSLKDALSGVMQIALCGFDCLWQEL